MWVKADYNQVLPFEVKLLICGYGCSKFDYVGGSLDHRQQFYIWLLRILWCGWFNISVFLYHCKCVGKFGHERVNKVVVSLVALTHLKKTSQ